MNSCSVPLDIHINSFRLLTWHEHGEVLSPTRVSSHQRRQDQATEEIDALYYVNGRDLAKPTFEERREYQFRRGPIHGNRGCREPEDNDSPRNPHSKDVNDLVEKRYHAISNGGASFVINSRVLRFVNFVVGKSSSCRDSTAKIHSIVRHTFIDMERLVSWEPIPQKTWPYHGLRMCQIRVDDI